MLRDRLCLFNWDKHAERDVRSGSSNNGKVRKMLDITQSI
jgi:hypothetical protein